jgi:hypothetical protein
MGREDGSAAAAERRPEDAPPEAGEARPEDALSEDERREFLAMAARLAVGAPMAAVLLAASAEDALAQSIPAPSDRRLKTDVERVGALPCGIAVYTFRYRWDAARFVGVMADEVERVAPGAVSTHPSGYRLVDYGLLLR